MLKVTPEILKEMEARYPGIQANIMYFENASIPACPVCGSNDTAIIQYGVIGRTISIATATTKCKLFPNANKSTKNKKFYCNKCNHPFFDGRSENQLRMSESSFNKATVCSCGGRVGYQAEYEGTTTPCPYCGKNLLLSSNVLTIKKRPKVRPREVQRVKQALKSELREQMHKEPKTPMPDTSKNSDVTEPGSFRKAAGIGCLSVLGIFLVLVIWGALLTTIDNKAARDIEIRRVNETGIVPRTGPGEDYGFAEGGSLYTDEDLYVFREENGWIGFRVTINDMGWSGWVLKSETTHYSSIKLIVKD